MTTPRVVVMICRFFGPEVGAEMTELSRIARRKVVDNILNEPAVEIEIKRKEVLNEEKGRGIKMAFY